MNDSGTGWIMTAQEALTADDTDTALDLYLVTPAGPRLVSQGATDAQFVSATKDLSVIVYDTAASLVPEDTDGDRDIYRWDAAHPGQVDLVSGGAVRSAVGGPARLVAMDPSGSSLILNTTEAIDPQDTDTSADIYRWTSSGRTLLSPGSSLPVTYGGASLDTRRVFFTTSAKLDSSDTNNVTDAYVSDLDTTPPIPTIAGPTGTSGPDVTLHVASQGEDAVWFDCQLDGGPWEHCGPTVDLTNLSPGAHTAAVNAYDVAANRSTDPATLTWTVLGGGITDTAPPSGTVLIAAGSTWTMTSSVDVATPATDTDSGVSEVALSSDGTTWATRAYVANQTWTLQSTNGTQTVWAKWKDGAGNWSDPVSDTIVLDTVAPSGTVSIAGGAAITGTTSVTVAVPATDTTSGINQVALSNDGSTWTAQAYASSAAWILTPGDGNKTVWVKWQDSAGNWSDPASDMIVLDTTVPDTVAPTAIGPTKTLVVSSSVTGGKPTIRFGWSRSDVGSGVHHYEFGLSTDGGAYTTVASSLASPTFDRALAPGHTYRAAVRATDVAGNVGAWAYGSAFKLTAYQEGSSAVHWTGTWHTGSSTSFWGGHDRYASAAGAKASLTFTGRSFAWVGSVGPSRGWAKVYVNGVLVKSVNLNAATNANRRILFATTWSSARSRTVTIRISGTAGPPRGDVDAFLTGS
jgi:hypothetical protein